MQIQVARNATTQPADIRGKVGFLPGNLCIQALRQRLLRLCLSIGVSVHFLQGFLAEELVALLLNGLVRLLQLGSQFLDLFRLRPNGFSLLGSQRFAQTGLRLTHLSLETVILVHHP